MKFKSKLNQCTTFSDVLRYHAYYSPHKIWLHNGISDRDVNFKEFDEIIDKGVSFLSQKGCQPGNIVSVILKNCLEYLILYFSSIRLGTILNPLPYNLSSNDIIKYIAYIEPKLVFCQKKHYKDLKPHFKELVLVIDEKENGNFLKLLDNINILDITDFSPLGNEPACIYYSSGTTGNPKGIVYSHKNMIANISSIVRGFKWNKDDCHLVFLPLGHTASINYSLLPCMYCGGKIVLFESFWKIRKNFWKYIEKYDVTYIQVVPSVLFSILNTHYKGYKRKNLKKFKYIGCGSAPLPLAVQTKIYEKFQIKVANLYGLSETGPTHVDDPLEPGWRPGSIGCALDINEVKIFNENGKEAKVGEVGEIAIKGENVFTKYYKNDKEYRRVFKKGYFFTGDFGYIDNKGIFYFSDRKKDLIIKGGINIFPGEIDEVIFSHPSIKEVATIGIYDDYLGELIKSFIVLKDNKVLKEEKIRQFCLKMLGNLKCPDKFIFLDEIPKTPSGKLLKRALKEK